MGKYDFSYELPKDFKNRVMQLLKQHFDNEQLARAFQQCQYEYEDLGYAYDNDLKGDTWDKHALDFTLVGNSSDIDILQKAQSELEKAMQRALRPMDSGFLIKEIIFIKNEDSLIVLTDKERLRDDIVTATAVLNDLVKISEQLSKNSTYNKETSENAINDYIRDSLGYMGYNEVKDQTRHGFSSTGKDAGQVDILITKEGKEIAIFEGMKFSYINSAYIDSHILKAIVNYNALGTATFIVAYISADDFESTWERYIEYLKNYQYPIKVKKALEIKRFPNAAVRSAQMILSRDGYDFPVIFMGINLN